ncbi:hypothetical protein [Sporolactobacillus nakayamae]|uniref:hypothetical protein n=1 Tax=Sporolactobacillus nakayamae TaxID=269670 RepID=UPI0015A4FC9D|nr:hypothetical protein [Sporolactobacillus nakayamae]
MASKNKKTCLFQNDAPGADFHIKSYDEFFDRVHLCVRLNAFIGLFRVFIGLFDEFIGLFHVFIGLFYKFIGLFKNKMANAIQSRRP